MSNQDKGWVKEKCLGNNLRLIYSYKAEFCTKWYVIGLSQSFTEEIFAKHVFFFVLGDRYLFFLIFNLISSSFNDQNNYIFVWLWIP